MRTMVPTARLHQEALQFRLILAATYPCFLAAAALARFKPARDASRSGLAPARHRLVRIVRPEEGVSLAVIVTVDKLDDEEMSMARDDAIGVVLDTLSWLD